MDFFIKENPDYLLKIIKSKHSCYLIFSKKSMTFFLTMLRLVLPSSNGFLGSILGGCSSGIVVSISASVLLLYFKLLIFKDFPKIGSRNSSNYKCPNLFYLSLLGGGNTELTNLTFVIWPPLPVKKAPLVTV